MELEHLGKRIREERLSRGITQEQLAEMADISLNFMSLIENGKNMSVQTLVNIACSLNVTVDYLLSDDLPISSDTITQNICQSLADLSDDEKLYFLNMIKLYKTLEK